MTPPPAPRPADRSLNHMGYDSRSPEAMSQPHDQKQNHDAPLPAPGTARPMRVIERGVYRGAHLYSLTPMIRIKLDLGSLEAWPSNRLPGFAERLLAVPPGLPGHGCWVRPPGGV